MPIIGPDGKPVLTVRKMFPAEFSLNGAAVILHADGRVTGDLEGLLTAFANCGPGEALPLFWLMAAEIRRQHIEQRATEFYGKSLRGLIDEAAANRASCEDLLASISAGHQQERDTLDVLGFGQEKTEGGLYPEDSFDILDPKDL